MTVEKSHREAGSDRFLQYGHSYQGGTAACLGPSPVGILRTSCTLIAAIPGDKLNHLACFFCLLQDLPILDSSTDGRSDQVVPADLGPDILGLDSFCLPVEEHQIFHGKAYAYGRYCITTFPRIEEEEEEISFPYLLTYFSVVAT